MESSPIYNESPYISGNADVTENSELISEHDPFKILNDLKIQNVNRLVVAHLNVNSIEKNF